MAANIIGAAERFELEAPQTGVTVASLAKMLRTLFPDEREACECAWQIIKAVRYGIYPPGYAELKAAADAMEMASKADVASMGPWAETECEALALRVAVQQADAVDHVTRCECKRPDNRLALAFAGEEA